MYPYCKSFCSCGRTTFISVTVLPNTSPLQQNVKKTKAGNVENTGYIFAVFHNGAS